MEDGKRFHTEATELGHREHGDFFEPPSVHSAARGCCDSNADRLRALCVKPLSICSPSPLSRIIRAKGRMVFAPGRAPLAPTFEAAACPLSTDYGHGDWRCQRGAVIRAVYAHAARRGGSALLCAGKGARPCAPTSVGNCVGFPRGRFTLPRSPAGSWAACRFPGRSAS